MNTSKTTQQPPCQYEDVMLYYQEKANMTSESTICGYPYGKKFLYSRDIERSISRSYSL
jgi:hypothetical protein